jgi:GxxExxY protein
MQKGEKLLYEDLTYQIRGGCFNVWKNFKGSFKESIIDKALTVEFKDRKLKVENQKKIDIYYKKEKVGTYIPDKIVNDKILIEIKCKPFLTKEDERQFWAYLKGSNYKLGMLVNFSPQKLEIKRRIYDKAREKELIRVTPLLNPRQSASTEKGFTLIELVIAIFILTFAVIGVYNAFSTIVVVTYGASDRFTAAYLAQEGLEIIRNIRDNNWIKINNWATGLTGCTEGCEADYNTTGTTTSPLTPYGTEGNNLKIDGNGFYNYTNGTPTKFKRKITIIPQGINVLKVSVSVTWETKGQQFSFDEAEEYLYDWY